jgi:hypothetical protein
MTLFRSILATSARTAGALLASLTIAASPATAGVNDPLQLIYFISGAFDSGGAQNTGIATVIHCSNWSGTTQRFQFVVFSADGAVKSNMTVDVPHAGTRTAATKVNQTFVVDRNLNTGAVSQGLVAVLATHKDATCTAQVLDASASLPQGMLLHGVRYNPIAATQE